MVEEANNMVLPMDAVQKSANISLLFLARESRMKKPNKRKLLNNTAVQYYYIPGIYHRKTHDLTLTIEGRIDSFDSHTRKVTMRQPNFHARVGPDKDKQEADTFITVWPEWASPSPLSVEARWGT